MVRIWKRGVQKTNNKTASACPALLPVRKKALATTRSLASPVFVRFRAFDVVGKASATENPAGLQGGSRPPCLPSPCLRSHHAFRVICP